MKLAITGRSGTLSRELQKLQPDIHALGSLEYNITDNAIIQKLTSLDPDIIIHAGAITDSNLVKNNPNAAISVNIVGTANLANYCITYNKRLVYISTDYVYEGTAGNYKETDPILPHNEYAWTKLGGECSTRLVPNHLIIRTSFGPSDFPYESAWTNQLVSKDYVDIIAPLILKAAKSNSVGTLNIGTEPKTLYDYAQRRNNVKPAKNSVSRDFSLNITKYEQLR